MRECYIVVHRNYAEGLTAYAFWSEEDARKDVKEYADDVVKSLTEQGYNPTVLENGWDSVEVYAADSNIYYEWSIIGSNVR